MFLERVSDLFLVIHEFLLLIFSQQTLVDSKDKGRSKKLGVMIELWEGMIGGNRVSLKLWTELNFDIIFGRAIF